MSSNKHSQLESPRPSKVQGVSGRLSKAPSLQHQQMDGLVARKASYIVQRRDMSIDWSANPGSNASPHHPKSRPLVEIPKGEGDLLMRINDLAQNRVPTTHHGGGSRRSLALDSHRFISGTGSGKNFGDILSPGAPRASTNPGIGPGLSARVRSTNGTHASSLADRQNSVTSDATTLNAHPGRRVSSLRRSRSEAPTNPIGPCERVQEEGGSPTRGGKQREGSPAPQRSSRLFSLFAKKSAAGNARTLEATKSSPLDTVPLPVPLSNPLSGTPKQPESTPPKPSLFSCCLRPRVQSAN